MKFGTIKKAKEVGINQGNHKVIWAKCPDCKKGRWVLLRKGKPESDRCYACSRKYVGKFPRQKGDKHWNWRGGRCVMSSGYIEQWMGPADPLYVMAGRDGYVYEHRLVMARSLGRPLAKDEHVHHLNGNKHDNRIENLQIVSQREHMSNHFSEASRLRKLVDVMGVEIESLRKQLRQKAEGA